MIEIRERRSWTKAAREMKQARTVSQFFVAVQKLLTTAQYRKKRASKWSSSTGKEVEHSWHIDLHSVVKRVTIKKSEFDDYLLKPELALMLDVLKSSGRSDIYAPVEADKDNAQKLVVVHCSYEQTGGGHNDSPTYEYVLCFTVGNLNKIVLY